MAERAGFEPAVHLLWAYNRLAGDRFRPLSHLSAKKINIIIGNHSEFWLVVLTSSERMLGNNLAEGAGFEPANLSVNGFQDRRHRPLGHPSM